MIDIESIKKRKEELTEQFNKIEKSRQIHLKQAQAHLEELLRLQGSFKELDEFEKMLVSVNQPEVVADSGQKE